MGEEKKPEQKEPVGEKKPEEAPKAEKPAEDKKKAEEKKTEESGEKAPPPPPPPKEIVLKVFMHCEGCARKVRRCLKGFEGVEDVLTDCRASKVVVKGEKADPLKVLERIQRKSHRQVELISPIPKPPAEEQPKKTEEKEVVKAEVKKEEIPVVTVTLKVYMHCEACAQEIKKRIMRMKGVESAEAELKSSEVTAKGAFQAEKLADYVYRRTGKHAVIVKVDPENKKEEEKGKEEEKKPEEAQKEEAKKSEEDPGKAADDKAGAGAGTGESAGGDPPVHPDPQPEDPTLEIRRNEYIYPYHPPLNHHQVYYPQRIVQEYNNYGFYEQHAPMMSPQIFSDENPNACSVM